MAENLTTYGPHDRKLRLCFSLFDHDNDGVVSKHQLGHMLRSIGQYYSWSDIKDLEEIKYRNQNLITYDDFSRTAEVRRNHVIDPAVVATTFQIFDKSGNGLVPTDFFVRAVTHMGDKVSKSDISVLLQDVSSPPKRLECLDKDTFTRLLWPDARQNM